MRLEPPVTSAGKADGRAGMRHEDEATMGGHLVSLVPECEEPPPWSGIVRPRPAGGSCSGLEPGGRAGSSPHPSPSLLCPPWPRRSLRLGRRGSHTPGSERPSFTIQKSRGNITQNDGKDNEILANEGGKRRIRSL